MKRGEIMMKSNARNYNRNIRRKKIISAIIRYTILIAVGCFMVYPLLWLVSASFKENSEIFTGLHLIPKKPTLNGYIGVTENYGGNINLLKSMVNSYSYIIPKVILTIISSTITAYGFARFKFKGRGIFFALLISTLFLPQSVLNVPQYVMFNDFGWVGSSWYQALYVPSAFAFDTYFVFLLIQFLRSIPTELDEAAKIDGCNAFQILVKIIAPMLKPAIVSVALFQFMWSSNDFMGPLLYANKPEIMPATLFVRASMDADTGFDWNKVLAISLISILPSLIVFFMAQKTFVEGITAGSVKG